MGLHGGEDFVAIPGMIRIEAEDGLCPVLVGDIHDDPVGETHSLRLLREAVQGVLACLWRGVDDQKEWGLGEVGSNGGGFVMPQALAQDVDRLHQDLVGHQDGAFPLFQGLRCGEGPDGGCYRF